MPLIFRSFPNNYWDKFVKRKVGATTRSPPKMALKVLSWPFLLKAIHKAAEKKLKLRKELRELLS